MENVHPLEAYTDDVTSWVRMGVAIGVAFGVIMTGAFLIIVPLMGVIFGPSPKPIVPVVVKAGLACGVLFGLVFPVILRVLMRRATAAVYANRAPFQVNAPGGEYTHRLPASYRISDNMAVGGVLFFSPSAIAFVPHARNLPQHRDTVLIPVDRLQFDSVPQLVTGARKYLFKSIPRLLRISRGNNTWLFLAPRPEETAARLRRMHSKTLP